MGTFNKGKALSGDFSSWNFAKSHFQLYWGLVWRRHHLTADNCSSGWRTGRRLFVWFTPSSAQLTALQLLARELSQYNSISRSAPAFQQAPHLPSENISDDGANHVTHTREISTEKNMLYSEFMSAHGRLGWYPCVSWEDESISWLLDCNVFAALADTHTLPSTLGVHLWWHNHGRHWRRCGHQQRDGRGITW